MKRLIVLSMIMAVLAIGCQTVQIKNDYFPPEDIVILMQNGELLLLKKGDLNEKTKGTYWLPLTEYEELSKRQRGF